MKYFDAEIACFGSRIYIPLYKSLKTIIVIYTTEIMESACMYGGVWGVCMYGCAFRRASRYRAET